MRKKLVVFIFAIFAIYIGGHPLYALVDTRISLVSNTYNTPIAGQGTMILDVESIQSGPEPENIDYYANAFRLDGTLRPRVVSVTFSGQHFDSDHYDYDETYDGDGDVNYIYDYSGTVRNWIGTPWTRIVRVTIVYNMTSATTSISWSSDTPNYTVTYEGGGNGTGAEGPVPTDVSLPVAMSNIMVTYSSDIGVTISWRTESEVDCEGFNIWRSYALDEEYVKINTSMIPGHGDSPTSHDYSFIDRDIIENLDYSYKIEEVSTFGVSTFFGPVSIQDGEIPASFELHQNYPNPFNPSTEIRYELTEDAHVVLTIYNLLGVEVRNFEQGGQALGVYTITWDGMDDAGLPLSSGIYFYKLTAGDQIKIRRMLKLK